jgi:hypothetical protein
MQATRFEADVDGPAGGPYALLAHLDVTDRKLAERATAVDNDRLRVLAGLLASGIGDDSGTGDRE